MASGRARKREYQCASCHGQVRKGGSGLGTWHCLGGCKPREYTIRRRCDSGKESERNPITREPNHELFPDRRPIRVQVILL